MRDAPQGLPAMGELRQGKQLVRGSNGCHPSWSFR